MEKMDGSETYDSMINLILLFELNNFILLFLKLEQKADGRIK